MTMGFSTLLGKFFKNAHNRVRYYSNGSSSTPFDKTAWEQDVFRATVDCIATHAAKGKVQHVVLDNNGRIKRIIENSPYTKLLNVRPNPLMSGMELKYRLFTQLETQTTAIAWVKWNGTTPEMICPVDYSHYEICDLEGGGYGIEFYDYTGEHRVLLLEDCIIMRKFYNTSLVSGDGNAPVYKILDMSKASDEGFIDFLNTSNKVRGIRKHKKTMFDEKDIQKSQEEFAKRFTEAGSSGGIISMDIAEDYIPITPNNASANVAQMKEISNRIYTYLRTPEEVVQSKYSEQVGFAWYESKIEPMWELFSEALTNACFTEREKNCGNKLIINGGALMGTSYKTRLNIITGTKDIGLLSTNEQREVLGYGPVEGGDKRQVSLNFINADQQDKYQVNKEGDKDGEEQPTTEEV